MGKTDSDDIHTSLNSFNTHQTSENLELRCQGIRPVCKMTTDCVLLMCVATQSVDILTGLLTGSLVYKMATD